MRDESSRRVPRKFFIGEMLMKLKDIGEFGLIALINKIIEEEQGPSPRVMVGVGDDAAVVETPKGGKLLLTTDTMVENVHFNPAYVHAEDVGYKAMASNISDIAAMAGTPDFAIVTLGLRPDLDVEYIKELYRGLLSAAGEYGVLVVGGDLTKSSKLFVTVALTGRTTPSAMRLRSYAKVGDAILLTGRVGGSAATLALIKAGKKPGRDYPRSLYNRHMRPVPRVAEAITAANAGARAIQDVSDGLIADLSHICRESGVGARVYLERVPVFSERTKVKGMSEEFIQKLALTGGEDYELLITAPVSHFHKIKAAVEEETGTDVTMIGEVTEQTGGIEIIDSHGRSVFKKQSGHDHFV